MLLQKGVEEPPHQELLANDVSLLTDALSSTPCVPYSRAEAAGRDRSGLLRPRDGPALSPGNSDGNTSLRGPAVGSAPERDRDSSSLLVSVVSKSRVQIVSLFRRDERRVARGTEVKT